LEEDVQPAAALGLDSPVLSVAHRDGDLRDVDAFLDRTHEAIAVFPDPHADVVRHPVAITVAVSVH
jgi:hypothetical protein